jgi:hypothetical protein
MIVVAQRPGRLGNLVLQYINLIAFSEDYGCQIANPAFYDYNHYFVGTHNDFLSRYPSQALINAPKLLRTFFYKSLRIIDQAGFLSHFREIKFINLPADDDFHLDSKPFINHFTSTRIIFFRGGWRCLYSKKTGSHLEKARDYFRLVPTRENRVKSYIQNLKTGFDIVIGVHIRQTDFKAHCGGKYYFTSQQYATIMKKTELLFQNKRVCFVICSDALQSPIDFSGLNAFFPKPEQVEDLFILAGCDFIIGPEVSSYCSLASLLGNKPRLKINSPGLVPVFDNFKIWNFD